MIVSFIKVILRLMLVQENYDQRAQVLTKDYKKRHEVGFAR